MLTALKRFAWFWLKSPQRMQLGHKTIITDLLGLLGLMGSEKSHETIWVCVGIKDRSENLKRMVASLSSINKNGTFGLSIYDRGSTDSEALYVWLRKHWHGELVWDSENGEFARAAAFNRAIKQATGDLIFACDADMTLPPDLENTIRRYVRPKTAWFPVCQWQLYPENPSWKWLSAGTGLFAAHKKWHGQAVVYDENYQSWGGEDWDVFFRCYKSGIMPLRTRCKGLYHHWHKSEKPDQFSNLF